MVQILYENEAIYKGQFCEIEFLQNRSDSQLNLAHMFTNAVPIVITLWVGLPGKLCFESRKRKQILLLYKMS